MSAFTFDFDLEDDLDESFEAIQHPDRPSRSPNWTVPHTHLVHRSSPPPAAAQLSTHPEALSYLPLALLTSGHTLVRRDLFDVHFQLLAQRRDEQVALTDSHRSMIDVGLRVGLRDGGAYAPTLGSPLRLWYLRSSSRSQAFCSRDVRSTIIDSPRMTLTFAPYGASPTDADADSNDSNDRPARTSGNERSR
ncbi:hypothetical protein EI94DRAFT_1833933 [Lactarius quietus]|nr:hypothetical protein EI94DRAFT_1833933 [Lactarius quietus]